MGPLEVEPEFYPTRTYVRIGLGISMVVVGVSLSLSSHPAVDLFGLALLMTSGLVFCPESSSSIR